MGELSNTMVHPMQVLARPLGMCHSILGVDVELSHLAQPRSLAGLKQDCWLTAVPENVGFSLSGSQAFRYYQDRIRKKQTERIRSPNSCHSPGPRLRWGCRTFCVCETQPTYVGQLFCSCWFSVDPHLIGCTSQMLIANQCFC